MPVSTCCVARPTPRRRAAAQARRAVVLEGGFLGVEIAIALADRGLKVTIIEQGPALLTHLEARDLSAYFKQHTESRGISLLLSDAAALLGDDRVEAVETTAGHRLACDLVIVSVGAAFASDFLAGSDVALEDGWIVIDRLLRTNLANVLAAGNIKTFCDPRGSLRSQS